ncbi:MAG: cation:proton antiporter [Ilumatobacter sp.]
MIAVVSPAASVFLLAGVAVIVLAGIGLFKLKTPYARVHAAGKASPMAFLIAGIGASIELGWGAAARLVVAGVALLITLPLAVHLLFRAVHRTEPEYDPPADDLRSVGRVPDEA